MKVVWLLIFWSSPLLQAGGQGRSLDCVGALSGEARVNSVALQMAGNRCFPGDSGGKSIRAFVWDEEDTHSEDFFDTGSSLSPSWRNPRRDDLSSLAHSHQELFRSPSLSHPLRC